MVAKQTPNKDKRNWHWCSYIMDIISLMVFCVAVFCEQRFFADLEKEKPDALVSVVSILLPVVFSIIAIALSIRQEKIYGMTVNELNQLRGRFYFTFFHKFLVFVALVVALCVCQFLNLAYSSICLNVISVIYGIVFCYQEMQVLAMNNGYIKKIIRTGYKRQKPNSSLGGTRNEENLYNAFRIIIFKEGILSAFNVLNYKVKNSEKENVRDNLLYLMEIQNKTLTDIDTHLEMHEKFQKSDYKGDFELDEIISASFSNLRRLLNPSEGIEIKALYDKIEDVPLYNLTWTLFSLRRICRRLELMNIFDDELSSLLFMTILLTRDSKTRYGINYSFIILMSIGTLRNGELWFVRALRDNSFSTNILFSHDRNNIGLFLSVMIYNTYINGVLKTEGADNIKQFLSETSRAINPRDNAWNGGLKDLLCSMGKLDVIDALLKSFKTVNDRQFRLMYLEAGRTREGSPRIDFDLEFIFIIWFDIIFHWMGASDPTPDELEKKLNELKGDYWEKLEWVLTQEILKPDFEKGGFVANKEHDYKEFFSLFNLMCSGYSKADEKLIKTLGKFINDERKKRQSADNKDKEKQKTQSKLEQYRRDLCEKFDKAVTFDSPIETLGISEIDPSKVIKGSYTISSDDIDDQTVKNGIFESYANEIIADIVGKALESEIVRKVIDGGLSDAKFEELKAKGFVLANTDYEDSEGIEKEDNVEALFAMQAPYKPYLPDKIFMKAGFASIYLKANESESVVRTLSESEINDIIDKEYKTINGVYVYNDYFGSPSYSVLLTRKELFLRLQATYTYVELHYDYYLEVHDDKYFAYKSDEDKTD